MRGSGCLVHCVISEESWKGTHFLLLTVCETFVVVVFFVPEEYHIILHVSKMIM